MFSTHRVLLSSDENLPKEVPFVIILAHEHVLEKWEFSSDSFQLLLFIVGNLPEMAPKMRVGLIDTFCKRIEILLACEYGIMTVHKTATSKNLENVFLFITILF